MSLKTVIVTAKMVSILTYILLSSFKFDLFYTYESFWYYFSWFLCPLSSLSYIPVEIASLWSESPKRKKKLQYLNHFNK